MKFCGVIPIYTAQQRPTKEREVLPHRAPDCQLGDEMSSRIPSLYKTPDYYGIQHLESLSQNKPLKMTARPSCFSFAVISLKGNNPVWGLKLSLYCGLFSCLLHVSRNRQMEGSGSWTPCSSSRFITGLESVTEATFQTGKCRGPLGRHCSSIPSGLPTSSIPTSYIIVHTSLSQPVNVLFLTVLFEKCTF